MKKTYITYTKSSELYSYVRLGYNQGKRGPIVITQGTLHSGAKSEKVYLITLSGTEFKGMQTTGPVTSLLSSLNLGNSYLKNVAQIIFENIPPRSKLIIAGHSLGGLIAQQLDSDKKIRSAYRILNIVAFGSPSLFGKFFKNVHYLSDKHDLIAYINGSSAVKKASVEDGSYGLHLHKAHKNSYARNDIWGSYDVSGKKFGTDKLDLNLSSQRFYRSPLPLAM